MTVYIVQNPMRRSQSSGELISTYDLTPARQYGELHVLLASGPVLIDPTRSVATLHQKLKNFRNGDHLLCLGDPVAIAAASTIVAGYNNGVVPLLVWDRNLRKYLSISVDIKIPEPLFATEPQFQ